LKRPGVGRIGLVGLGVGRTLTLLLGLLGMLAAGPSWGQAPVPPVPVCPSSFPVQPPTNAQARRQELQRLDGLARACNTRADYFAWVGVLWLTGGRPQQAAIALEKALLLDPDLPGAELDYAQALAELGERAPARQLVQSVLARPDIPRALHDWLTSREGDWGDWDISAWQWRWQLQSLLGSESNLNSAPSSNSLTLTLPGGSVPLLLSESEQPHAGMASLDSVALEAARPLGQGRLSLSGEATLRLSPGDSGNKLQWLAAAAAVTQPVHGFDAGMRLGLMRLRLGGVDLYDENALKLFAERPLPWGDEACRAGAGLDDSSRNYPASPTLDGRYRGGQLGLGCQLGGASLSAIGQWGLDRAQSPLRLGGDQRRDDFLLAAGKTLGPRKLTLSAQWSRLRDVDIYSPLLGNVAREIRRRVARLQYEHSINNHMTMVGYVEKTAQSANIDLFAMENRALYLGLRWSGK